MACPMLILTTPRPPASRTSSGWMPEPPCRTSGWPVRSAMAARIFRSRRLCWWCSEPTGTARGAAPAAARGPVQDEGVAGAGGEGRQNLQGEAALLVVLGAHGDGKSVGAGLGGVAP